MVDTEVPIKVACQWSDNQRGEDSRVEELAITCLWDHCKRQRVGVYEVDGSVFLNADRPTPTIGTLKHTGVKACNGPGLAAWKNSRR